MADTRKVALVTGGCRGIGLGIAKRLAVEGCDIAICDIVEEGEVAGARDELQALGAEVLYVRGDISRDDDRRGIVDAVGSRFGRLHALVNNAGVAPLSRDDILEATEESFERLIRINLQGPYFLTQHVANWMVEQKRADPGFGGTIVFIGSMSATIPSVSRGDYCISKAGIAMTARLFATRLADSGICVYEVRPGIIATDMTAGVKEKYDRLFADGLALQPRWGTVEDVGRAVAMLVRGDLAYSTGQVIGVDGGITIKAV